MNARTAITTAIFVFAVAMVITLIVFWSVFIIKDFRTIQELYSASRPGAHEIPSGGRWTVFVLGICFLTALIGILSVFFANILRGNRFKQQQRDFANMVTHELRLPLSSIQVFAQTLLRSNVPEEQARRFIEGILGDCSRLNHLIDHLLKLQQLDQGKLPVEKLELDVRELVKGFADKWPRPVEVTLEAEGCVLGDPMLLELALSNLVNNAEKYGGPDKPELRLSKESPFLRISVRDRGRPLSKRFQKNLFRRFSRLPNRETRRQVGVGLGLYIVRAIARIHKGKAEWNTWDNSKQSGNEFSILLPRRK
jgi:signal transduction histidine kinase